MTSTLESKIAHNAERVEQRIAKACRQSGRRRDEITLVAVTKTRSAEEVIAAYHCGLTHLGENRVEELEDKRPRVTEAIPAGKVTWHMIGHIQSRKASRVVQVADVVHSVDSLRLARRLERYAQEQGLVLPVLLETNVSHEESKYGFPAWDDEAQAQTVEAWGELADFSHVSVQGLMTMAPLGATVEEATGVFRALRHLRDRVRKVHRFSSWDELSMGMTDDFEPAIREGATMVRIGRAIFGPRNA